MTLPVTIGKTSTALDYSIDLAELPNLFVSYCDDGQIQQLSSSFIKELYINQDRSDVQFAVGETGSSEWMSFSPEIRFAFRSGNEFHNPTNTRDGFMLSLSREMHKRKALRKKLGAEAFEQTCPYLVVFLHDVFELVLSSKKVVGLTFLQLLLWGKSLKVHTVAASCSTYRNLLRQFMHLNPIVKAKFKKVLGEKSLYIPESLGSELILTSDDFPFFRASPDLDYQRLYPTGALRETQLA
ncbi:MAG TPA: hypothetical protein VM843_02395 [Flavisolibacter sp.]|jgi:hypothetical protein|nr:hypothetical protein [Flavisolibacter sp.]